MVTLACNFVRDNTRDVHVVHLSSIIRNYHNIIIRLVVGYLYVQIPLRWVQPLHISKAKQFLHSGFKGR